MPRALGHGLALALAIACLAPPCFGQNTTDANDRSDGNDVKDRSRAAFRRGVTLVKDGDYKGARDAFLEAHRLFPHPSILLNLGIARWRVGEYVDAEQDLAKFLSDDGGATPEEIASARSAIASVRQHLGTLRIRVSPNGAHAKVDTQPIALVPGEVRVTVGSHVVLAEAEGYDASTSTVVVVASTPSVVDVVLTPSHAKSEKPVGSAGIDGRSTAGWILLGTSVVAAGVGVFTGLRATSLASDYNDAPAGHQDPGARSTGVTFRTATDVLIATAVVSAGIGVYLLLTPTSSTKASATIAIGPFFSGAVGTF